LRSDGHLLLGASDPASRRVVRITSRLITALEEQDNHVVCGAAWPPRTPRDLGRVMSERDASEGRDVEGRFQPSGVATSSYIPFRPISSNPLKKLESGDWNLYVIDSVRWCVRLGKAD
jgi:hypothetical protein